MGNSVRKTQRERAHDDWTLERLWRGRVRRLARSTEPITLANHPKVFLHLTPTTQEPFTLDRRRQGLAANARSFPLLFGEAGLYSRINLDGFFSYLADNRNADPVVSYCQLFWDGSIEFGDTALLQARQEGERTYRELLLPYFEFRLFKALEAAVALLKKLEVPLPVQIRLAIIGGHGVRALAAQYGNPGDGTFDGNELFFEPIALSGWDNDLAQLLRPLFDQVWNAGGYLYSQSYDPSGAWKPKIQG